MIFSDSHLVRRITRSVAGTVELVGTIALAVPAVPFAVYACSKFAASLTAEGRRDLGRDLITFVRELQEKLHSGGECKGCRRYGYSYMLRDEVWEEALTDAERDGKTDRGNTPLLLCPACVSKRLGRALTMADFDPKYGINWPIFCAFAIAEGGEAPDFETLEKLFDQAEECDVARFLRGERPREEPSGRSADAGRR